MNLQLIHTSAKQGPLRACILAGADASELLSQMKGWQLPLSMLECYYLPSSLQDRKANGLLVVFQGNASDWPISLHFPLRIEGESLLLPQNALLQPQLLTEELRQFSKWQYALLHPSLGLIGFEPQDQVDFLKVILPPLPSGNIWDQAIPPTTSASALISAQLEQPKMEEIWEEMRGEVGSIPLEEIPKDEQPEGGGGFLGSFLDGLGGIADSLKNALPKGGPGDSPGPLYNALDKFKQWADQKQEEMGAKAQSELERLMKLFKENPEEALKYAPPIDSSPFSRASGNSGFQLGKNDLKFDPNRVNRSSGAGIDIGSNMRDMLWKHYHAAAKKAMDAGEHEKAAYIYAHLLQNYHQAAEALVAGRRFREAAMLYQQKLKNPQKAADCYFWAGDYLKAAEIFVELKNWEKAGDMFVLAGNQKQAAHYFDRQINYQIDFQNFQQAADIAKNKLQDHRRMLDIYLLGWQKTAQSQLLTPYLQAHLEDEQLDKDRFLSDFFHSQVNGKAHGPFVSTLSAQLEQWKAAGAEHTIRSIAYEIGLRGAEAKNRDQLSLMAKLIPEDRFVKQDIGHYAFPESKQSNENLNVILRLDPDFQWKGTCQAADFDLAWGLQGKTLKFARINGLHMQEAIHPEDIEGWTSCFLQQPIMERDPAILFQDTASTPVDAKFPQGEGFAKPLSVGSNHYLFADYKVISGGFTQKGDLFQILCLDETQLLAFTYDELSDIISTVKLPFSTVPGPLSEAFAMYKDIIVFRDRHKINQFLNEENAYRQSNLFQFGKEIQAGAAWRNYLNCPTLAFASQDKLILVLMSKMDEKPKVLENHQLDQAFGSGDVISMQFISESELLVVRSQEMRLISINGHSASSKIYRISFGNDVVGILQDRQGNKMRLLLNSGAVVSI